MRHCFDLARQAAGYVSPNPLVGAVLIYNDRIIGQGYHQSYGGPHAERNAIMSVASDDQRFISESTLYVSLEPCCHHGRTPPCTGLILSSGIRKVVVSLPDPNPLVCGKGIAILRENGVDVTVGVLEESGADLIRYFNTYMSLRRPHIILKVVQSADGFIGKPDRQVWLSNSYEQVMVHKLRSEVDAIMVGTNTAVLDNPKLTARNYPGHDPVRITFDRTGRIPHTHHLFDGTVPTRIYTEVNRHDSVNLNYVKVDFGCGLLESVLSDLFGQRIQSLLVEGGAGLINTFLDQGLWDEALVVRTPHKLDSGIRAPLIEGRLKGRYRMDSDEVLAIVPDAPRLKALVD